jgi:hypothetical protein
LTIFIIFGISWLGLLFSKLNNLRERGARMPTDQLRMTPEEMEQAEAQLQAEAGNPKQAKVQPTAPTTRELMTITVVILFVGGVAAAVVAWW